MIEEKDLNSFVLDGEEGSEAPEEGAELVNQMEEETPSEEETPAEEPSTEETPAEEEAPAEEEM